MWRVCATGSKTFPAPTLNAESKTWYLLRYLDVEGMDPDTRQI